MAKVSSSEGALTFNGPLEAGVRAVAVLASTFPAALEIERLTAYDYLLVHTSDLGGPPNLHPDNLIKAPATEVRRGVVQSALLMMMTRDLVERVVLHDGFRYKAGESATVFLNNLRSPYLMAMKDRAAWIVATFQPYEDVEFQDLLTSYFDKWVVDFQAAEQSLAADQ